MRTHGKNITALISHADSPAAVAILSRHNRSYRTKYKSVTYPLRRRLTAPSNALAVRNADIEIIARISLPGHIREHSEYPALICPTILGRQPI